MANRDTCPCAAAPQRPRLASLARAEAPALMLVGVLAVGLFTTPASASAAALPRPCPPGPNLTGSCKSVSQRSLAPGEVLTYVIRLHDIGTAEAVARVVDRVPPELSLVPGSVTSGALVDAATSTLVWANVTVPVVVR